MVLDILDKEIDNPPQIEQQPLHQPSITSFKIPEVLQEMISHCMPGYVLVQKKKLLEALSV